MAETSSGVTIVINQAGLRAITHEAWVKEKIMEYGEKVAGDAAGHAPRRTGAGAGSIHAEPVEETTGWTARVSWDEDHYYMRFQDEGTVHINAQHFLELGLRDVAEVTGDSQFGSRKANAKPLKRASRKALYTKTGEFNQKYYGGTKRKARPKKSTS